MCVSERERIFSCQVVLFTVKRCSFPHFKLGLTTGGLLSHIHPHAHKATHLPPFTNPCCVCQLSSILLWIKEQNQVLVARVMPIHTHVKGGHRSSQELSPNYFCLTKTVHVYYSYMHRQVLLKCHVVQCWTREAVRTRGTTLKWNFSNPILLFFFSTCTTQFWCVSCFDVLFNFSFSFSFKLRTFVFFLCVCWNGK